MLIGNRNFFGSITAMQDSPPGGVSSVLKKALLFIGIPLFILVSMAAGLFFELKMFASTSATQSAADPIIIDIRPGQTLNTTADILYRNNIIKSEMKFVLIARIKGYDKRLKAGEYLLSPSMTPLQLLDVMVRGTVKLYKLTIPEGYNLFQIAELVEAANFGTRADFIQAATDSARVRQNGLEGESFEGYLFPDTYFFPREVTMDRIISAMVKRFWSVFIPEWQSRAQELGLTVHRLSPWPPSSKKKPEPPLNDRSSRRYFIIA